MHSETTVKNNSDSCSEIKTAKKTQKKKACNNWTETGFCKFGKNCAYEHPTEESKKKEQEEQGKPTKCRTFYYRKYCQMGSTCSFRHEYKKFQQLLRHYYVVKMYCLESLYSYSVNQTEFVNDYDSGVSKLPIFKQIHKAHSDASRKEFEQSEEDSSAQSLFKDIA